MTEEGIIGKSCWTCKWRKLDNWYASSNFCQWYPSYKERSLLKGHPCGYYERKKGRGKRKRRRKKQDDEDIANRRDVTVHISGFCDQNLATYGFVIYVDGEKVHEGCGVAGEGEEMSNDVAEFVALIEVLKYLRDNGYDKDRIIVRANSQLLVNTMSGRWILRNGSCYSYYLKATRHTRSFHISYEWVPRIKNKEAATLARKASSTSSYHH